MNISVKSDLMRRTRAANDSFKIEKIGTFERVYFVEFLDNERSVVVNGIKHVFQDNSEYIYKISTMNRIIGNYHRFKSWIMDYYNGDHFFHVSIKHVLEKLAKNTVAKLSDQFILIES